MIDLDNGSVGKSLRHWRRARGCSQMQLALECDTSSRHISCVENGHAKLAKNLLLRLCRSLDVPLRSRNSMLRSAGFMPYFLETGLSEPEMAEARLVLEKILKLHEPYPAMLIDRYWNIVLCNPPFRVLAHGFVFRDTFLDREPWNLLRLLFHPDGWACRIVNLSLVYRAMMGRAQRTLVLGETDGQLRDLMSEMAELQPEEYKNWLDGSKQVEHLPQVIMPIHFRNGVEEVRLITTVATLGAPENITLTELKIECGYPVDAAGEKYFANLRD